MKCSMMFRRAVAGFLAALLSGCLILSASGAEEASYPDGSGSILLVHDRHPDQTALDSIEKLVTLGAAMRKVVDYGDMNDCRDVVDQYDYVICYDIRTKDSGFVKALRASDVHLMFIGGTLLEDYLYATGNLLLHRSDEAQKNGQLTYRFPSGVDYEGLVHWEALGAYESDGYESGTILAGAQSYPFCTEVAGVRFIPTRDLRQNLVLASVMQEIVYWMWPYKDRPTGYAQFLVMDSVYPFMPADQLLEKIRLLEEESVPYVISVMPLENNTDYPAMKQFCQVLAYAQSLGATVILHAPILHKEVTEAEELYEKLTDMTMPYIENGVYPVGIEVPHSWINREPYLEVLKRYTTVFVYDDGKDAGFDLQAHTSLFARNGHQMVYPLLELDQAGISQLECYASATYVDCTTQFDRMLQYARNSRGSSNPFLDLREYDHTVWLNDCNLAYQSRMVYVDGEQMQTTFQPVPYDTSYDFGRSPLRRITLDLQSQNRILMVVVVVLTAIFLLCIAYARKQIRKRFFSPAEKQEE